MKRKNHKLTALALLPLFFLGCASLKESFESSGPPLSREEIIELARSGASDDEIIKRIDDTWTVLDLKTADILEMKKQGVNEKVIDHLLRVKDWVLINSRRGRSLCPSCYEFEEGWYSSPWRWYDGGDYLW